MRTTKQLNQYANVNNERYVLENGEWKQIDWETEEYLGILHRTQNMIPIDSGKSLHCHHSDYDLDGRIYRLTWEIGKNNKPTINFKISNNLDK